MAEISDELWVLLNGLCEGNLTPAETARLEELVLASPEARQHYVTYLHLHATLYWDAAGGLAAPADAVETGSSGEQPLLAPAAPSRSVDRRRTGLWATMISVAALRGSGRALGPPRHASAGRCAACRADRFEFRNHSAAAG